MRLSAICTFRMRVCSSRAIATPPFGLLLLLLLPLLVRAPPRCCCLLPLLLLVVLPTGWSAGAAAHAARIAGAYKYEWGLREGTHGARTKATRRSRSIQLRISAISAFLRLSRAAHRAVRLLLSLPKPRATAARTGERVRDGQDTYTVRMRVHWFSTAALRPVDCAALRFGSTAFKMLRSVCASDPRSHFSLPCPLFLSFSATLRACDMVRSAALPPPALDDTHTHTAPCVLARSVNGQSDRTNRWHRRTHSHQRCWQHHQ